MSGEASPFVVGAAVAVSERHQRAVGYHRRTVAKVYKNGNFVLDGERTQWRPYQSGSNRTWCATACPDNDHRTGLIWNAETEAGILASIALADLLKRKSRVLYDLQRLMSHQITLPMLEALEAALKSQGKHMNDRSRFLPAPPSQDTRVVRRSREAIRDAIRDAINMLKRDGVPPEKREELRELLEAVRRAGYAEGYAAAKTEAAAPPPRSWPSIVGM